MIEILHERCDRCGTCVSVCRDCALLLTERLNVDPSCCRSCGVCVRVCPVGALRLTTVAIADTVPTQELPPSEEEHVYDILVVGGGPAGAMAAYHAAGGALRVGIVDRNQTVGMPVRCGEAVGVSALESLTSVDPAWIAASLRGTTMVSPSGIEVRIDRMAAGWVVRRDLMDQELVARAVRRGAVYHRRVTIVSARRSGTGYECRGSRGERFRAVCLILADGVESRLARLLGWVTALKVEDISSCAFARVRHSRVPTDRMEMHYGSTVAPCGYAWVFPRGGGSANVGVGVLGTHGVPGRAMECLQTFVKRRFGDVEMTDLHCGGVPVGRWTVPLVRGGVMLVGDAGRQVDALTGGGITHAMRAGRLAGEVAVRAFEGGAFRAERLKEYERAWTAGPGKALLRTYALKRMVIGLTDAELDRIARRLTRHPRASSLGLAGVCFAAFARRPLLLLKALMVYR